MYRVWYNIWRGVWESVPDGVWRDAERSVWGHEIADDGVWQSVRESVAQSVTQSGYGQHDASWLAVYDYFRSVCGLLEETRKLTGLMELASSAGWWLPHAGTCWISERHCAVKRDPAGRLHCETGPALAYPDGFALWAWHGVSVPQRVVEQPGSISCQEIEAAGNAELRRVLIALYGFDRYLRDAKLQVAQRDDFGTLYRREIAGEPPLVFVEVVDATAEPDGTFKRYVLPCRSTVRTAHEAVAASFGLDIAEYNPIKET